jgi:hypothetical protein
MMALVHEPDSGSREAVNWGWTNFSVPAQN